MVEGALALLVFRNTTTWCRARCSSASLHCAAVGAAGEDDRAPSSTVGGHSLWVGEHQQALHRLFQGLQQAFSRLYTCLPLHLCLLLARPAADLVRQLTTAHIKAAVKIQAARKDVEAAKRR